MGIPKHEYYEGAAMLSLIKRSSCLTIEYCAPFYRIGSRSSVYMKYSAHPHTNWAFTFARAELQALAAEGKGRSIIVCLICGSDGYVKLNAVQLEKLCSSDADVQRIGCTRRHGEHYEVSGPAGKLGKKIAPSEWSRAWEEMRVHEAY